MQRRKFIKTTAIAGLAASILPISCNQKSDSEFLILGGGLSGLYLAWLLDKANIEYILLEGSNRFGGRLFTHPKLNREVGGRGIGDRYDETMKIINEFKIGLIDITKNIGSPSSIYLNGKLYSEWPESATNPSRLEFSKLKGIDGLSSLNEWYQRADLDIPYNVFLKNTGLTEAELNLINRSANYNDIFETSAINSYHSRAFRQFNGSKIIYNFEGGAQSLIDKIVQNLKGKLEVNKMVSKINDADGNIQIHCADGSTYQAKKAISTLPFTTLRKVKMNNSFSKNQTKAINELAYTHITQIHFRALGKYWEEDQTAVSMWTDTPLERIMDFNPSPDQTDLAAWVNGKGTAFFDKMTDSEIAKYTIDKMKEMRPASEGQIEYIGSHKWGQYKYNYGAYAEFKVGQAGLFEDMIKPAGNLHFAGEHTAAENRGIEAACESARRVFNEITNN